MEKAENWIVHMSFEVLVSATNIFVSSLGIVLNVTTYECNPFIYITFNMNRGLNWNVLPPIIKDSH